MKLWFFNWLHRLEALYSPLYSPFLLIIFLHLTLWPKMVGECTCTSSFLDEKSSEMFAVLTKFFPALSIKYKYLRMIKLQLLNTTHNFLTNFHTEKLGPILLFSFLTWYKVMSYTGNASWPMKLISGVFNLITWLYPRTVSGPYITY